MSTETGADAKPNRHRFGHHGKDAMTATPAPARPRSLWPVAALLIPTAGLVWAFWTTFADLAQVWKINPQYSHGWLVPLFAAVLLYARRHRLDFAAFTPSVWGVPLLALGVGLRLVGAYYYYAWLDPISLLPTVFGVGVLVGGRAFARWAWPAVLFLAFMVPLPYRVAIALSGPLQHLATVVSTFFMQILGLPALAEGNVILLNDQRINIVEACSGLSMLVVFVAMSAAMAIIVARPLVDRLILLVSAIPIAIAANVIRITVTGVLYESVNGATAHAFFHDLAGLLMPVFALGLLWLELKVLGRLFIAVPAGAVRTPAPRTPIANRAPRARQVPAPGSRGGSRTFASKKRAGTPAPSTSQPTAEKT
jgi:exosortase